MPGPGQILYLLHSLLWGVELYRSGLVTRGVLLCEDCHNFLEVLQAKVVEWRGFCSSHLRYVSQEVRHTLMNPVIMNNSILHGHRQSLLPFILVA